jgi:hypothetical protein
MGGGRLADSFGGRHQAGLSMRFIAGVCAVGQLALTSTSASAGWLSGWFGPSNYNECMVEKMKGQPWNMAEIVSQQCVEQICTVKFNKEFHDCRLLGIPAARLRPD